MRATQILLLTSVALATAACARQQVSYAVDPATHRPVAVAQRNAPVPYSQPQYAQARYQQAPANGRGLLSTPQITGPSYAQANQPAAPQPQTPPGGRGLFNTFGENQTVTAYPQPAYSRPTYAPQATHAANTKPTYARPGYAQSQQRYVRPPAPAPYQPPSYRAGATYAVVTQRSPFEQARWY